MNEIYSYFVEYKCEGMDFSIFGGYTLSVYEYKSIECNLEEKCEEFFNTPPSHESVFQIERILLSE